MVITSSLVLPTRICLLVSWNQRSGAVLFFLGKGLVRSEIDFLRADRHDEVRPRTDIDSCAQDLGL